MNAELVSYPDDSLTVSSQQVTHFRLRHLVYPENIKISSHDHERTVFCMALDGGCQEAYGSVCRVFTPFTMSFLPAAQPHSLQASPKGMRSFTVQIEQEWLASFADNSFAFGRSVFSSGGELVGLYLKLFREFQISDTSSPLAMEGLVLEMLAQVARDGCRIEEHRTPKWLRRATDAIHEQIENPPRLTQLAVEAGVHPVHLARTFRRIHGCTVGEYTRRVRAERASEMLALQEIPLAQIAATLGFCDQSHFARVFKRVKGVTPLTYRLRSTS